ncbi:MAG TPA: hypothetical protein VJ579_04910 [Candidatus Paceibacterota bacterium]|nr:hypothetical protein [Candidatus Paceibacterota bacterium]
MISEINQKIRPLLLTVNTVNINECINRLTEIEWFENKLKKYTVYFKYFYVELDAIPDGDALQYHIHSYYADVYAYKERLLRFIKFIKKNIPRDEEVVESLNGLIDRIDIQFKPITDIGNNHKHGGNKGDFGYYINAPATEVEILKNFSSILHSDGLKDTINWDYANILLREKEEKAVENLDKEKELWSLQSKQCEQWSVATSDMIYRLSDLIYEISGIRDAALELEKYVKLEN